MNKIEFYIPGLPKALKRHRMTRGGRVYDPSCEDKKIWMEKACNFCPSTPLSGALHIDLEFVMPRPKAHFKSGKNQGELKLNAPKHHLHTPDLDNLVKFVLDAMNAKFYIDDSQIISIKCSKSLSSCMDDSGTFVSINCVD